MIRKLAAMLGQSVVVLVVVSPSLMLYWWGDEIARIAYADAPQVSRIHLTTTQEYLQHRFLESVFYCLPYAMLVLSGLLAWRCNLTKATFLSLSLVGVLGICSLALERRAEIGWWLGVSLPLFFVWMFYAREHGVWSFVGLTRMIGMMLLWWGAIALETADRFHLLANNYAPISLGTVNLPWFFPLLSVLLMMLVGVLSLLLSKQSERRAMIVPWSAVLFCVVVGIAGWSGWWMFSMPVLLVPFGVHSVTIEMARLSLSFHFTASGILLLGVVGTVLWSKAFKDGLTRLPNRRALEEALDQLGWVYTIGMVDIDHFKSVNDKYGHKVGDETLAFVASRLGQLKLGTAYRYGGEEFCVLFRGYSMDGVRDEMERFRQTVERHVLTLRSEERNPKKRGQGATKKGTFSVTISIGLAQSDGAGQNPREIIERADQALYRAKQQGRNRVITA